jgi:hypothetical protein
LQQVERHKDQAEGNFTLYFGGYGFVGRAYQGKDVVFRLVIEYSSLWDFGP